MPAVITNPALPLLHCNVCNPLCNPLCSTAINELHVQSALVHCAYDMYCTVNEKCICIAHCMSWREIEIIFAIHLYKKESVSISCLVLGRPLASPSTLLLVGSLTASDISLDSKAAIPPQAKNFKPQPSITQNTGREILPNKT